MSLTDKMQTILMSESDNFLDLIKEKVAEDMRTKYGNDDILPMLFLRTETQITVICFPDFMHNEAVKNKLFYSVIPSLMLEYGSEEFTFVSAAWFLKRSMEGSSEKQREEFIRNPPLPSKEADRQEVMMLNHGDAENSQFWTAPIIRRGMILPAELGAWERTPSDGNTSGRAYQPLMDAACFNRNPERKLGAKIIRRAILSEFTRIEI